MSRLGSSKSIGPNAQLAIYHDACMISGVALAVGLHGSGALAPLTFLLAGKMLVSAAQALHLRRIIACAGVLLYAALALALNNACAGAGLSFWAERLLGAGSRWLPLAAALDRFAGVAPPHWTVGVTFRYTLMRFIRYAGAGSGACCGGCRRCSCATWVLAAAPAPTHPPLLCQPLAAGRWTAWMAASLGPLPAQQWSEPTAPTAETPTPPRLALPLWAACRRAGAQPTAWPCRPTRGVREGHHGAAAQCGGAMRCPAAGAGRPPPLSCPPPSLPLPPHLRLPAESPQKVHAISLAALQSSTWAAYLSYTLFAPTFLSGPILTAADFYQQAAAACAGRNTTRALPGGAGQAAAAACLLSAAADASSAAPPPHAGCRSRLVAGRGAHGGLCGARGGAAPPHPG